MSFWSSADTSNPDNFVGTGSFIADRTILTVKHLLETSPDSGAYTRQLWAKPWAGGEARCVTVKATHESLDVAIVQIDHHPDGAHSLSMDFGNLEFANQGACTLNGYFRGALQQHGGLRILSYDGANRQVRIDVKQPVGYSGGAVCTNGNIWAVLTRHYQDANIHIGCAVALWQYKDWLTAQLVGAVGERPPIRCLVQAGAGATPSCQALAKALSSPVAWEALVRADLVAKLELEVRDIREEPGFSLPEAQSLYALCAASGTDPKRLLRRMAAVVIGPQGRTQAVLPQTDLQVRHTVVAVCKVLAERYIAEASEQLGRHLTSAHDVRVPVQSDAIAALIAALWIHDEQGIQLEIGLTSQDHEPKALGAMNITNTALEIGYPPADSATDLVKAQIYKSIRGQSAVVPTRPWKDQALDDYTDQHIPALKSLIRQTLGDGLAYDLVLALDGSRCPVGHLLADPQTRADIKAQFGIWTVIYGASDTSLAATRALAETIETAFKGIFAHL